MCFPHIINIICQHVIAKMCRSEPPEQDDDDENEMDRVALQDNSELNLNTANTHQAAYDRDPIARCRKIVVAIRSSGQRREKFETWIKNGRCFLPLHAMIEY
jgi:hypothetical protein